MSDDFYPGPEELREQTIKAKTEDFFEQKFPRLKALKIIDQVESYKREVNSTEPTADILQRMVDSGETDPSKVISSNPVSTSRSGSFRDRITSKIYPDEDSQANDQLDLESLKKGLVRR